MELINYINKLESNLRELKIKVEINNNHDNLSSSSASSNAQDTACEEVEEEKKRGRPKGKKTEKERYKLEMYNIEIGDFKYVSSFSTFADMSNYLKERNLDINFPVLKNIYQNKSKNQFIRITSI